MKTRYPYAQALAIAEEIAAHLTDLITQPCTRLEIAGSLRRQKPDVGDIEIVYIPRTETRQSQTDMFATEEISLADEAILQLIQAGILKPRENKDGRQTYGPKNKLCLHIPSGIPVDLFATTEAAWWNYLVCRTGPAELNQAVATRAQQRGWKWQPYGAGFVNLHTNEVAPMASEEDVFKFVALDYLQPVHR